MDEKTKEYKSLLSCLSACRKLQVEFNEVKDGRDTQYTFNKLAEHFSGFNCDDELFDFYYGDIAATVTFQRGIIKLSTNVEYYDEDDGIWTFHLNEDILGLVTQ